MVITLCQQYNVGEKPTVILERLLFVPFWTSADEWLLVEAASGVIHAAPNQAEPETNQEWNLSHRKGSLLLGSPTEHYLVMADE